MYFMKPIVSRGKLIILTFGFGSKTNPATSLILSPQQLNPLGRLGSRWTSGKFVHSIVFASYQNISNS